MIEEYNKLIEAQQQLEKLQNNTKLEFAQRHESKNKRISPHVHHHVQKEGRIEFNSYFAAINNRHHNSYKKNLIYNDQAQVLEYNKDCATMFEDVNKAIGMPQNPDFNNKKTVELVQNFARLKENLALAKVQEARVREYVEADAKLGKNWLAVDAAEFILKENTDNMFDCDKQAGLAILQDAIQTMASVCQIEKEKIEIERAIIKLQNEMKNLPFEERLKLAEGEIKISPSKFQDDLEKKQKQFEKNIANLETLQEVNSNVCSVSNSRANTPLHSRKNSVDLEKKFKIEVGENTENISFEEWLALKNQKQEMPKRDIVKGTKQITAAELFADEEQPTQPGKNAQKPVIPSDLQKNIQQISQRMTTTPQSKGTVRIEYPKEDTVPKIYGRPITPGKSKLEERMKSLNNETFNPLSTLGNSVREKKPIIVRPNTVKSEQTLFERKNFMQEQSQKLKPLTNPKGRRNYHSSEKNQTGVKLPAIDSQEFQAKIEQFNKNAKVGSGLGLPPSFPKRPNTATLRSKES